MVRSGGGITNGSGASIAGNGDSGWGIYLEAGGNIANAGSILGGNGVLPLGIGVVLKAGGTVVNETGVDLWKLRWNIDRRRRHRQQRRKDRRRRRRHRARFRRQQHRQQVERNDHRWQRHFLRPLYRRLANDGVVTGHGGDGVALLAGGRSVNGRSASIFGRDAGILVGANTYVPPRQRRISALSRGRSVSRSTIASALPTTP